ncbi:hypothetical protein ACFX2J_010690 [Malus domestica]|uniref:Uncharacterized protein n=1 Tax=Malus domestica TaxID=3750 RepID=A0A498IGV5_MALDO|nr:hypothetical protein DVH24_036947 [Malus domestica]
MLSQKIWRDLDLRCVESVKAHEDAVNALAMVNDGTMYTRVGSGLGGFGFEFGEDRAKGRKGEGDEGWRGRVGRI